MRSRWGLVTSIVFLISLLVVVWAVRTAVNDRSNLRSVLAQRTMLSEQVKQFQALRVRQEDTIYGAQPESDFEQRISESLQAAGLSTRTPYTARREADQDHRNAQQQLTGLRERRASVEIPRLSPDRIGRFLVHWQASQKLWTPDRIRLTHDPSSDQNIYTLRLECIAVYHAQESE
jgi:hypothetical protein